MAGGGEGGQPFGVEYNYSPPAALDAAASTSSSGGGSIAENPILLLELFHKAIKAQLDELGRAAASAAEGGGGGGGDLVADLRRRFEFLKQVYKYHCAAEDEVIFVALDVHMKNISCSYCLEHKSIDDLFESIFCSLNLLSKSQGIATKELQEVVFCVGALKKAICKHMLKEEEQVFPLLMKQFTSDEQASLVWQVICSVPIMVLVDLFSWFTYFLSPEEHRDLKYCINKVVPKDTLLQELVISWLNNNTTPKTFGAGIQYGKLAQCPGEPENLEYASELFLSQSFSRINNQSARDNCLYTSVQDKPVNGLHLWHAVIKQDLKEILSELHEMKRSSTFSTLDSVIVRFKFIADVLIFYSDVLDKIFYPLLEDLTGTLPSIPPFFDKDEVEGLQEVLYHGKQTVIPFSIFVQNLLTKMEPFTIKITQQLSFQESEVFPLIINKCNHETQVQLLFLSLHMMPLGLLKCVITWFSSHLPKDKLMYILHSIKESDFLDKSFASLLHEWVRTGYSGKTSVKDLQEMFKSNVSYLGKQTKDDLATFRKLDDVKEHETSHMLEKKNAMIYSREINMRVHFPQTSTLLHPILESPTSISMADSLDPRPIDHIYYFHKAVKRELEYLVQLSNSLPENFDLLFEFCRRFDTLRLLCQLHREAEDAVAFPALETKETGQNISQSYSIDHKLETVYFKEISDVLSKMSELHILVSSSSKEFLQLSLRLQDGFRSLQKMLGDHNDREEIELLPVFRNCFSTEEQEKIVGQMLGRARAEHLQEMILWLMELLNPEEQHAIISFWRKATKNTMFDEWLTEWWEGTCKHNIIEVAKESDNCSSETKEILDLVWKYISYEDPDDRKGSHLHVESVMDVDSESMKFEEKTEAPREEKKCPEGQIDKMSHSNKNQNVAKADLADKPVQVQQMNQKLWQHKGFVTMSQQELEATIRRVSRDSSLDSEKKTRVIQYLLSSRWNMVQQQSISEKTTLCEGKLQGQFPSYRDEDKSIFGCKHYKQNCKLITPCCNQIFTCRRCHDDVSDHQADRKSITQMMCMKCLVIQPIGSSCVSCNFSMAKYYCRICRLFDDERVIYHCPFCNLCRLGKGLGIDFFHCMKCNACMSPSLSGHVCREKCLEDVCPICHEDMFTSSNPVKQLDCGHLMHSTCFQEYTRLHYVCPVCSKSLGDMKVYFAMLDAYLAEEKLPDEYCGQTQAILCNDCGRKGTAPFHWLHHKCTFCGSYNTRVL